MMQVRQLHSNAVTTSHLVVSELVLPAEMKSIGKTVSAVLSPVQAKKIYQSILSKYELKEIENYTNVYFVGITARKVCQSMLPKGLSRNNGYDDENDRYKSIKNDHLGYRYEILKGLGKGSFGDVVKVYDHKTLQYAAIKIIRNTPNFHRQAQDELHILEKLNKHNSKQIVQMLDFFMFRNHMCIVFELLYTDLYTALRKNVTGEGFSFERVRSLANDLISCLCLLSRNHIIHSDLKPENIAIISKDSIGIKVIDFGSSCFDIGGKLSSYVQSRFYRSPEVILGAPYGKPIDMWSLGCILAELFSGQVLFPGHDENEQIKLQVELLGLPPLLLLKHCKYARNFFDQKGNLLERKKSGLRQSQTGSKMTLANVTKILDRVLLDFIERCLNWNPALRLTPEEAKDHPLLSLSSDIRPLMVGRDIIS